MEKINVAELLKDCPQGMELDCTMYDKFILVGVDNDLLFPIKVMRKDGCLFTLTKYGQYCNSDYAKCIIFPKGKTTWKGFHRPFEDGDIIHVRDEYSDVTFTHVAILKQIEKGGQIYSHCFYNYEDDIFSTHDFLYDSYNIRFATEEEKAKLFDAIKTNGYKWNPETKTLEKLTPNKFDINTLVPFESRVLVRDNKLQKWSPAIWGFYDSDSQDYQYKLVGIIARYCIPYEGNEHLLGKTDACAEYFKTWK